MIKGSGIRENELNKMFNLLVDALEQDSDQDFLGEVYHELKLTSYKKGQFFTPYCASKLIAQIGLLNETEKLNEVVRINDPSCGSGSTLIATVNILKQGNKNPKNYFILGQDIDFLMALTCYVQLSLQGIAGAICIGDSLHDGNIFNQLSDQENTWILPVTYVYYPELLINIKNKKLIKSKHYYKSEKTR